MFPWDASMESRFSVAAPELQPPAAPDVLSITSPRAAGTGRAVCVPLRQPRALMAVTVTVSRDLAGRPNIPEPSEARGPPAALPALARAEGDARARSPCPALTAAPTAAAPWSAAAPARPPAWGAALPGINAFLLQAQGCKGRENTEAARGGIHAL